VGFGFSNPVLNATQMVGSDVTVAGFFQAQPFASDYFISLRSQCDYSDTQLSGVCPDGNGFNDIQLVSGLFYSGVTKITFIKKFISGDTQYDYPIDVNQDMYAVWAMGPFQDGQNQPVILAHSPQNHADAINGFRIRLNQTINMCPMLMGSSSTTGNSGIGTDVIDDTIFDAIVTNNGGIYPNSPGWGVSWKLNGKFTPIIRAIRGVELTFKVAATEEHPLYITSSIIGGHSSPSEVIFAGGPNSWGNSTNPYILKWTPDDNTPDFVYYQCYTHQKLGWKIQVENSAEKITFGIFMLIILLMI